MRRAVRAIVIKDGSLLVMRRNKFGEKYYTLIGGGVDYGETPEQSLFREIAEESMIEVRNPQLVFIEEAGTMFGTQYIYHCEYVSGVPQLSANSEEQLIHKAGENLYEPMWLPLPQLAVLPFRSETLRDKIVMAEKQGYPTSPELITSR